MWIYPYSSICIAITGTSKMNRCISFYRLILNKKDRRLKKGSGYHADLALIGICAIIAGVLGLPMICAATVRTVSHVSALSVYSRDHAPGEKPKLEEVKEQRVTAFFVHILIGKLLSHWPLDDVILISKV